MLAVATQYASVMKLSCRGRGRDASHSMGQPRFAMATVAPDGRNPYISGYDSRPTEFAAPTLDQPESGIVMTNFEDRERAFENQFAKDADTQFRIIARRNRLLGGWAAGQMGLTPEEADAYATSVVQADFEEAGDEDVVRKLFGDLTSAGVETSDAQVRAALEDKMVAARRQLIEGV